MDRVFLDANVLFSAAYKTNSRLNLLWQFPNIQLLSSDYAVKEVETNLRQIKPDAMKVLAKLLQNVEKQRFDNLQSLPPSVYIAEKDAPILQGAITAKATHLLTGDFKHFKHLYGTIISGVKILPPAKYLETKE